MNKYILDEANHDELHLILEATIQEWCGDKQISGDLIWLAVQNYATARIKMLVDNRL